MFVMYRLLRIFRGLRLCGDLVIVCNGGKLVGSVCSLVLVLKLFCLVSFW